MKKNKKSKNKGPDSVISIVCPAKRGWFNDSYGPFLRVLSNQARVLTATGNYDSLPDPPPKAVIITDAALVGPRYPVLMRNIRAYCIDGGTVILAFSFSTDVQATELNEWFREQWALPWQYGGSERATVNLNPDVPHIAQKDLPTSYSQRGMCLRNVRQEAILYRPKNGPTEAEEAFAEFARGAFTAEAVDSTQATVAYTAIGNGYLGYAGDRFGEKGSESVIMAMCGLQIESSDEREDPDGP